jgi:uncharacterized membrane protein
MKNELLFMYRNIKSYIAVGFPVIVIILVIYLYQRGFSFKDLNVHRAYTIFVNFIRIEWKLIFFSTLILSLLLWLSFSFVTKISMEKLRKEKKDLKEKSEVANMRLGAFRE